MAFETAQPVTRDARFYTVKAALDRESGRVRYRIFELELHERETDTGLAYDSAEDARRTALEKNLALGARQELRGSGVVTS